MSNAQEKILQSKVYTNNSIGTDLQSKFGNFEFAIVTDVISDANHPIFRKIKNTPVTVDPSILPRNYNDASVDESDIDYSYVGRIKIRILNQHIKTPEDRLPYAIPLDKSISQFPLTNECVLVIRIGEVYYYTKPLNIYNFTGVNGDFSKEQSYGSPTQLSAGAIPQGAILGHKSYISDPIKNRELNQVGFLGKYFIINPYIRSVKSHEGDTIVESRFGQSIKFSAYTDDRSIDKGSQYYSSYKLSSQLRESVSGGYGNPRITIRNRQRNISKDSPQKLHPKLPQIPVITDIEKNYGGYIDEDINNDGSTIEISSGKYITKWNTTVYKSIFAVGSEEQSLFSPLGATAFKLPIYDNDQIVINSDRLILSSRFGETLNFSKKRYSIVTDNEFTVDSHDQLILTTNRLTSINSPQIFLGQYGETNEPVLLGQTTTDWLYDLCNWLLSHVHWYNHVHPHPHGHPDAGAATRANTRNSVPNKTQIPVQQERLKYLRDKLHENLSRRVFVTGGGYAPGANGVSPLDSGAECVPPLTINVIDGQGVVGEFKGKNRRDNTQ